MARNAPAGEHKHTAVDLALECRDFDSASMLFGVGCNASVQAGDLCNEALERSILQVLNGCGLCSEANLTCLSASVQRASHGNPDPLK